MYEYRARVTRVVDGDTVDLLIDLGFNIHIKQRVRLDGIDTPETRTKDKREKIKGLAAKQFVTDKIGDKFVIVKTEKKGKYGRCLAVIWYEVDGHFESLNEALIKAKLAKRYYGGKR